MKFGKHRAPAAQRKTPPRGGDGTRVPPRGPSRYTSSTRELEVARPQIAVCVQLAARESAGTNPRIDELGDELGAQTAPAGVVYVETVGRTRFLVDLNHDLDLR